MSASDNPTHSDASDDKRQKWPGDLVVTTVEEIPQPSLRLDLADPYPPVNHKLPVVDESPCIIAAAVAASTQRYNSYMYVVFPTAVGWVWGTVIDAASVDTRAGGHADV